VLALLSMLQVVAYESLWLREKISPVVSLCLTQTQTYYTRLSSGTSSKSTKLVHGGVRYLQKAVFELDYEQYKLVREALRERRVFLQTAPYLSHMLPIMLPIYKCVSNSHPLHCLT
jgi:hypothetical protein